MKIAVVGLLHHPIAEPFAGGMESHTWWLAKKLIERGHDVTLFASGDSDADLGLVPCIEKAFATNPLAQTMLGRQACNMSAYASIIRKICEGGFDVVHNNALHPILLLSAADLPIPMLNVLHTPPYKELAAAMKYAAARNTQGKLESVAVSRSLAQEWMALIPSSVVYNGIDVEGWLFSAKAEKGAALWYGRIVPEKAPHLAIQAALKAGYSIKIAGPISDDGYFNQQVAPLLKDGRVTYLGHLTQTEVKQALSRASVFVNTPMWKEPYGLVYAESLAAGTPVASFESGAASEIVDIRSGVIVQERTVEALAEAIVQAAQLSRQDCRKRAESFCHLDNMIDGYERMYRQLIRRQQRWDEATQAVSGIVQGSLQVMGIAS